MQNIVKQQQNHESKFKPVKQITIKQKDDEQNAIQKLDKYEQALEQIKEKQQQIFGQQKINRSNFPEMKDLLIWEDDNDYRDSRAYKSANKNIQKEDEVKAYFTKINKSDSQKISETQDNFRNFVQKDDQKIPQIDQEVFQQLVQVKQQSNKNEPQIIFNEAPLSYDQLMKQHYDSRLQNINLISQYEDTYNYKKIDNINQLQDQLLYNINKNRSGSQFNNKQQQSLQQQEIIEDEQQQNQTVKRQVMFKENENEQTINNENQQQLNLNKVQLIHQKQPVQSPESNNQLNIEKKPEKRKLENQEYFSRELPNSAFSKKYGKPPFENYGNKNISPSVGGVVYGNYLRTHNVNPHKNGNQPEYIQSYANCLESAQDPKQNYQYINNGVSHQAHQKFLIDKNALRNPLYKNEKIQRTKEEQEEYNRQLKIQQEQLMFEQQQQQQEKELEQQQQQSTSGDGFSEQQEQERTQTLEISNKELSQAAPQSNYSRQIDKQNSSKFINNRSNTSKILPSNQSQTINISQSQHVQNSSIASQLLDKLNTSGAYKFYSSKMIDSSKDSKSFSKSKKQSQSRIQQQSTFLNQSVLSKKVKGCSPQYQQVKRNFKEVVSRYTQNEQTIEEAEKLLKLIRDRTREKKLFEQKRKVGFSNPLPLTSDLELDPANYGNNVAQVWINRIPPAGLQQQRSEYIQNVLQPDINQDIQITSITNVDQQQQ